jgi:hypothetical protein
MSQLGTRQRILLVLPLYSKNLSTFSRLIWSLCSFSRYFQFEICKFQTPIQLITCTDIIVLKELRQFRKTKKNFCSVSLSLFRFISHILVSHPKRKSSLGERNFFSFCLHYRDRSKNSRVRAVCER